MKPRKNTFSCCFSRVIIASNLFTALIACLICILLFRACDYQRVSTPYTPKIEILHDNEGRSFLLIQYHFSSPIGYHYSYFFDASIDGNAIILGEWSRKGIYNPFATTLPDNIPFRIVPPLPDGKYIIYNGMEKFGEVMYKDGIIIKVEIGESVAVQGCLCPSGVGLPKNAERDGESGGNMNEE